MKVALTIIGVLICGACASPWPSAGAGTVRGRVLWNERPVAGASVYVTSEYSFNSTRYGKAKTDRDGHFTISGIPEGDKYLYVFGPGRQYWVSTVTPFAMNGPQAVAPDSYLCRGFDPLSPKNDERVVSRPVLRWNAYPDATSYAVRIEPETGTRFIFSRGDDGPRLLTTSVQVDTELESGAYSWRVDAFNAAGHIIGCSFSPRGFSVRS